MKPVLLVAMLAGFLMPVYGQQQLCFSKNCAQTPATSFKLDRSDKQLNNLFQPLPSVPTYSPLTPLALSPSAKQFLHYSAPVDTGPRLGRVVPGNATAGANLVIREHPECTPQLAKTVLRQQDLRFQSALETQY